MTAICDVRSAREKLSRDVGEMLSQFENEFGIEIYSIGVSRNTFLAPVRGGIPELKTIVFTDIKIVL